MSFEDIIGKKDTVENDIYKTIDQLFNVDDKNLDAKTDLHPNEVILLSQLSWIAKMVKSKQLIEFINEYKRTKISINRMGRKEFVRALMSAKELELAKAKTRIEL